jgi:hypothetical protein
MSSFMTGVVILIFLHRTQTDSTVRGTVCPSKEMTHRQDRYPYCPRLRCPSCERDGRCEFCIPGDYDGTLPDHNLQYDPFTRGTEL